MTNDVYFEKELADAEQAVRKAEETYGKNHVNVSYQLDAVVRLLRSKGIRPKDADSLEARARAIRIQENTGQMKSVTSQMRDISDAVKSAAARREKEKKSKTRNAVIISAICLLVVGKFALFPSEAEKQLAQTTLANVNKVLPTTMVTQMISKTQGMINDTKPATAKHNQAIQDILDGKTNSEGEDADGEEGGDADPGSDTGSDSDNAQ